MAGRFVVTTVVDRPIDEVFAFLADGESDAQFSPQGADDFGTAIKRAVEAS